MPERKEARLQSLRLVPRSRAGRAAAAFAALLALGGGAISDGRVERGRPAASYTTAIAQRGDLEDTVTATGILQPRDYVTWAPRSRGS